MGVTYKAYDVNLHFPVALKVIHADCFQDSIRRQRFVSEARGAARLRHRHIASVFHLGSNEDLFFYAMEYVDGETVQTLVDRLGPMRPVLALQVAGQVAQALAAAARHQLVHRDIKPENLMITCECEYAVEPMVKVIDFGLVRSAVRGNDPDVTDSGFVGTAQYASPEQMSEKELDGRSDIYSLGCTLWFLLTGEPPFKGSLASVFAQHLNSSPPWGRLARVPRPVRQLLGRMLEKDPEKRTRNAVDLQREIEECLAYPEVKRAPALTAPTAASSPIAGYGRRLPLPHLAVAAGLTAAAIALVVSSVWGTGKELGTTTEQWSVAAKRSSSPKEGNSLASPLTPAAFPVSVLQNDIIPVSDPIDRPVPHKSTPVGPSRVETPMEFWVNEALQPDEPAADAKPSKLEAIDEAVPVAIKNKASTASKARYSSRKKKSTRGNRRDREERPLQVLRSIPKKIAGFVRKTF